MDLDTHATIAMTPRNIKIQSEEVNSTILTEPRLGPTPVQLGKKQEELVSSTYKARKTTYFTGLRKNTTATSAVPVGYSIKNWDPTEEPVLLLGSTFDANSLGKWIYDWTVYYNGLNVSAEGPASGLWPLLFGLAYNEKNGRNLTSRRSYGTEWRDSISIVGRLHKFTRKTSRSGFLRLFSWGSLIKLVSALPVDPGEVVNRSSGWPSGPGLPSISGWPSPILGLLFAAAATALSKSHSTSRIPGSMALVFNYVSLVTSADVTTPPAVMWTLKSLATYFVVFYGDIAFRRYHMSQGYFALLIILGSFLDYFIVQTLHASQVEGISLTDDLLRFALPAFSLSLFLCAYHAYCMQYFAHQETDVWLRARAQLEEQSMRSTAGVREDGSQQSESV
ncbi:hypothetical protein MMC11_004618 [Xylographa trunciseda]|nr:hypothetical protein [Xylographa trunciseda]